MVKEHGTVEQPIDLLLDEFVQEVTPDEALSMFDALTRRYLGISAEEFLRRWDAGEYADDPDQPGVRSIYPFMPFVRPRH